MALWTCISCGATERLTFYPDCCSSCGGSLTDESHRTLVDDDEDLPAALYHDAEMGDRAAIVALWQAGALDWSYPSASIETMRSVIDDMLLENRVSVMMAVYSAPEREAA
ncbi:hypothetical protein [Sinorhizobium chiapasense]|uniref:Uncharacterized protein n=1 Tax=Sinorhizobium chiapasense TaxID=501572 RepID=A0ABZ2BAU3_9HYPH